MEQMKTSKLLLTSSSDGSVLVAVCFVWCSEVRELQLKLLDSISIMETLPSLSQRIPSGTWSQGSGSMTLLSGSASSSTSELQYSESNSNTISYWNKKYNLTWQTRPHPMRKKILLMVHIIWIQCVFSISYQTVSISLGLWAEKKLTWSQCTKSTMLD